MLSPTAFAEPPGELLPGLQAGQQPPPAKEPQAAAHSESADDQHNTASHQHGADNPSQLAAPLNEDIEPSPSNERADETGRYPDCEFDDIQECDLAAQQNMAQSAEISAYSDIGNEILTIVAVILLALTFVYTRKAAKYAGIAATETKRAAEAAMASVEEARKGAVATADAAKAAADANELNRAFFTAEQRSWIACNIADFKIISPLCWTGREGHVEIQGRIKNIGRTPAFDVYSLVQASSWKQCDADAQKLMETLQRTPIQGDVLFPNDYLVSTAGVGIREHLLDKHGRIMLMFIKEIRYRIALSGELRYTTIIVQIARVPDKNGSVAIGPDFENVPADQLYFRRSPIRRNVLAN